MEIFIGADYRGFELKKQLIAFLSGSEHTVVDEGAFEITDGDDFNDPAIRVSTMVRDNPGSCGILICDSAHGVTIQANRFKRIRAAHCDSAESAKLAREHDDANVLCLSAHFMNVETAENIVQTFLQTDFEPLERRVRRINRLDEGNNYD